MTELLKASSRDLNSQGMILEDSRMDRVNDEDDERLMMLMVVMIALLGIAFVLRINSFGKETRDFHTTDTE
jgi:hypothetical protein